MVDKKKSGYKFMSENFVYGGYAPNLYKHDWKTPAYNVEPTENYNYNWQLTPTWDDNNDK